MSDGRAHGELAELRAQLAALERLIAEIREGQAQQQRGMEGMEKALSARLHVVEALGGSRASETRLGLALEGLGTTFLAASPPELSRTDGFRSMLRNRKVLSALEWQTQRRATAHDDAGVLQVARAAGDWACMHHPGVFASPAIERSLQDSSRRLLSDLPPWSESDGRRVLHVMTIAHPIGGHTRLAERWMRLDASRSHSVALTEQGDLEIPASLAHACEERVHVLTGDPAAARVHELARLARAFDLVVLHIHPYDAVAVAAFGDTDARAPTLLVDHGDHIFWLGTGAADTVVSVRPSGSALVVGRRGIDADRNLVIPLPLDPVMRHHSRLEAKAGLGLPAESLVLLTIASGHKFAAVGACSFGTLVGGVLERVPRAVLLAIGPEITAPDWQILAARFPGRIRADGPSIETTLPREAADLYLDSFPFGSPTSLFESVLYETPAVVLRPPGVGVLAVEDAEAGLTDATDGDSWIETVCALLEDDGRRELEGRRLAKALRASHETAKVSSLIARASERVRRGSASLRGAVPETVGTFDAALIAYQDASGLGRPLEDLLAAHGLLPHLA